MEQNDHPASARPKPRLTRAQYMRRKRLRLARNWAILLLVCAAVVALMTKGILWLLPKANALLAGPQSFEAASYDGTAYAFDADDARLVLVNANLPYAEEPAPVLAAMTDDSTIQLEAEAAEACRAMLEAAKADGIELVLNAGYLDADGRSAVYERRSRPISTRARPRNRPPAWPRISSPGLSAVSTAPAMRWTSSVPTTPPGTPALPPPAPTSGSRPTPPNTASSCAIRRTGRPRRAWCSSPGTGGMWAPKTPSPSAPAA